MMLVWGRRGQGAGTLGPDENDDGIPCVMPSLCIVMLYCLLCVAHVYYMNVYDYYL